MRLAKLQRILRAVDPAAVLVGPRVMDSVIQEVCRLPALVWQIPHRRSFVVDRQVLFRHVEQHELELEADQLLPPTLILLARPGSEELNDPDPGKILLRYWRRLFHANVHLALNRLGQEGKLTDEDLRQKIEQIGQAEFEEIRTVLVQDGYLLSGANDRSVYIEFAAVYQDMRHFAANLLPIYFPSIRNFEGIDRLLAGDLDARDLFTRTRLPDAPDPVVRTDPKSDEAYEFYWKLVRGADHAASTGNNVRAAILRRRAARVAPAPLAALTQQKAVGELKPLTARLQKALQLTDAEAAEWLQDLSTLLDRADQGKIPVEATLLHDLQKLCVDFEREIYALDVVECVLSAGKRPIKRPLPSQRHVRVLKHLANALQRLTRARLSDTDRQHLGRLLEGALRQGEQRLHARFRPVLTTALQDAGLQPTNPPERAAFDKMVEELLERITAHGFFTFSDLRDTISRNQLKLPDLFSPQEFIRGDPLLRLDRRLATLLDGVYRPSEVYMRLLERLTALNFGTPLGRLLTRFVTLPFGAAFILVEGVEMVLEKVFEVPHFPPLVFYGSWLLVGFFILALLHSASLRRRVVEVGVAAYQPLRLLFYELPLWVVRIPLLRRLAASWTFQLFYWCVLKPLLLCALIWLWLPATRESWLAAGGVFLAVLVLLNSRFGQALQLAVVQGVAAIFELLRAGLLPGLINLIIRLFKEIVDAVEYVLFTVDEWLRFRGGDSRWSVVVRAVLGLLWYPVSYLIRFYMVVLVEPGINPIKLPVSTIAAKLMLPIMPLLAGELMKLLTPVLGDILAGLIVYSTLFLLPDAFGFLFWETKENWSLYRANRPRTLKPAVVGAHGETVGGLLRPGFHSGTIPKLYTRLRRAERRALRSGNWRGARAARQALHEAEEELKRFVDRELVSLVSQATSWRGQPLDVGAVILATNRIRVELVHEGHAGQPVWLELEQRADWLVAGIRERGWLDQLDPEQTRALNTALAGLYKFAGVHLVREQISASLPSGSSYEVTPQGLVLWLDRRTGRAFRYDLRHPQQQLHPTAAPGEGPGGEGPVFDAQELIFAQVPVSWEQTVQSWQKDQDGQGHPRLLNAGKELSLVG